MLCLVSKPSHTHLFFHLPGFIIIIMYPSGKGVTIVHNLNTDIAQHYTCSNGISEQAITSNQNPETGSTEGMGSVTVFPKSNLTCINRCYIQGSNQIHLLCITILTIRETTEPMFAPSNSTPQSKYQKLVPCYLVKLAVFLETNSW